MTTSICFIYTSTMALCNIMQDVLLLNIMVLPI